MKRNFEKTVHILNQMMGYCKNAGATVIDTRTVLNGEHVIITVSALVTAMDDKALHKLRQHLEMPRQPEIEQNYWNIGLSGNLGDEIALVGMMTDNSEVRYDDGLLILRVERQN